MADAEDARRAGAPVHPHVLDAELGALPRIVSSVIPLAAFDHHCLDAARDRGPYPGSSGSPSTSSAFGLTAKTS